MLQVRNVLNKAGTATVRNQFEVVYDSPIGRVVLFQSYDTPIAMTINVTKVNKLYYIETTQRYSNTTTKYQRLFFERRGKHIVHQAQVNNFNEWVKSLNQPILFNQLLLNVQKRGEK